MSKGEIVQAKGEGLYVVNLLYGVERVKAELEAIATKLAELEPSVIEKQQELSRAEDAVRQINDQIGQAIGELRAEVEGSRDKILKLQHSLVNQQVVLGQLKFRLNELRAEQLGLRKRQAQLERLPEKAELEAWCGDYTYDLQGTVGLVDVNDEGGAVVIQPGYEGAAEYDSARDGQLMHREAQSGAQVYFNAAVLPGVQKWFPRYRVATITRVAGDLCDVTLETAHSTAQNLDINQEQSYRDVPIQYMDCNGAAFEQGDPVLIRFFSEGPQVVGFVSNPRPCVVDMTWRSMQVEYRPGGSYPMYRRAELGRKDPDVIEYYGGWRPVSLYDDEEWYGLEHYVYDGNGVVIASIPAGWSTINSLRVFDNAVSGRKEIWVSTVDGPGNALIAKFTTSGDSLGTVIIESYTVASGNVFMSTSPHYYIAGEGNGLTIRRVADDSILFPVDWCDENPHEQTGLVDITDELAVWACKNSVNCLALPSGDSIPVPVDMQYLTLHTSVTIDGQEYPFTRGIMAIQLTNNTLTVFGSSKYIHYKIVRGSEGQPVGFDEISRYQYSDFENYGLHVSSDRSLLRSVPPE